MIELNAGSVIRMSHAVVPHMLAAGGGKIVNVAAMAGLNADVIDAIQAGRRPARMQADEAAVYDFCSELRDRRRVSDRTFKAAIGLLGEQGVVDLLGVIGYYDLVAMTLNVDRYPLPAGTAAPFAEPK